MPADSRATASVSRQISCDFCHGAKCPASAILAAGGYQPYESSLSLGSRGTRGIALCGRSRRIGSDDRRTNGSADGQHESRGFARARAAGGARTHGPNTFRGRHGARLVQASDRCHGASRARAATGLRAEGRAPRVHTRTQAMGLLSLARHEVTRKRRSVEPGAALSCAAEGPTTCPPTGWRFAHRPSRRPIRFPPNAARS